MTPPPAPGVTTALGAGLRSEDVRSCWGRGGRISRACRIGLSVAVLAAACSPAATPGTTGAPSPEAGSSTTSTVTVPTTSVPSTTSGGRAVPEVEGIVAEMAPPGERVVLGTIEYFEWVAECARRAGESVTVSDNPPVLSAESNPRTRAVLDACHAAAADQPWFVEYPFDGSAEANRLEYRLYLQVHECLQEHGYPTVEPPSEETYVAEGSSVWHPFDAMPFRQLSVGDEAPPPGASEQLEAQRRCGGDLATLYQQHLTDDADEG